MTRKRTIGTLAAVGGVTAAVALLSGAPAANADELTDLRANQELLQRRLDQLAQARAPGNPYGVGSPAGPTTVQMMGGSFPRSFLIPGTNTSIRVGGEIRLNTQFYVTGGNANQNPQGTNAGTTGQLNSIPLKGTAVRSEHDNVLNMNASQSKMNVETRTPTAWGEARTFLEFDFAGGVADGSRSSAAAQSLIPRLRYAYGTLGGLLFGQANSNFNDADAGLETLDFGGLIGGGGPARVPQIRYTAPLASWGLPGALSVSAEQPETEIWAPGSGVFGANGSSIATVTNNATCVNSVTANVNPATPLGPVVTNVSSTNIACISSTSTLSNPLKNTAPDLTASWYIPQPWGHVNFASVVRPTLRIEAGNTNKTYVGYGFAFSGDVKPRWFGWDRDYIVWGVLAGEGMGRYHYAGAGSSIGLVSNVTQARLDADTALIKPTRGFAGRVGYRHQWGPQLRSNFGVGYWHLDINGLNGQVCPGTSSRTSGGCALNKELAMGVANLIWAPVPFVDIGVEYVYGRRKTVSNAHGDQHVIETRFRVQF